MKIEADEDGILILLEVYTSVGLITADNESMYICMRDSGFEFTYEGRNYSAQNGVITAMDKPAVNCEKYDNA